MISRVNGNGIAEGLRLDLNGRGEIAEYTTPYDSGNAKRIYRTSGGLQVGCTFVTRAALDKLIAIYQRGKP